MKRRAIVEKLGDLRHRLDADRNEMSRLALHLRSFNANHNAEIVIDVIDEIERFNLERLGDLRNMLNELIEKEDV